MSNLPTDLCVESIEHKSTIESQSQGRIKYYPINLSFTLAVKPLFLLSCAMRYLLLLMASSVLAQESSFTNGRLFRVEFDVPLTQPTNVVYRVHTTTNLNQSASQWAVNELTIVPVRTSDTYLTVISTNQFPAYLPVTFYTVSASNEWGVSFAATNSTRPPELGGSLRLR